MFGPEFHEDFLSFQAILPPGTELVGDATKVAPDCRYWILAANQSLTVVPQEPRLLAASSRSDARTLEQKIRSQAQSSGVGLKPLGLVLPHDKPWPIADAEPERYSVIFRRGTKKNLAFYVRRDAAVADLVVKIPMNAPTAVGCKREYEILTSLRERGALICPSPLKVGQLVVDGEAIERPFFAQSFVSGTHAKSLSFQRFATFLDCLRLEGETVTLCGLADQLKPRVEGLRVSRGSRTRLQDLLRQVTHQTPYPAAISHGDCWRDNLIDTPDSRLVAIDWEYSHAPWLGFLDVVQAALTENYLHFQSKSFELTFTSQKLNSLKKFHDQAFGRNGPGLGQVLALHFAQHYIDRIECACGTPSPGLKQLDRILNTDWPEFSDEQHTPNSVSVLAAKEAEVEVIDDEVRKVMKLLSYTKSSNSAYSAKRYASGYHTMELDGLTIPGQRNPEQRLSTVPFDFTGKTVLDIGCNQGGMLFQVSEKIEYGIGVDYDSRMINAANRVRAYKNKNNLGFYVFDLENEEFDILESFLPDQKVDISFLLSVCMWLKNWREIIDLVHRLSTTLLFESNGSPAQQEEQERYLRSTYSKVDLLQETSPDDPEQKARKLFICDDLGAC